jgi:beta-galactosidase/beta-glucuronidase
LYENISLSVFRRVYANDEVPAVGLSQHDNFSPVQLNLHKNLLKELFDRDNHHTSVIMWSLANEPGTEIPAAVPYFQ